MTILACVTLAALTGVYVLIPLFKEPKGSLETVLLEETELDRLLNRKAVVYSNIKDLEFEYKLGRLSDADFKRLETGYKEEAALILHKLDELGTEQDVDALIEKEVAARKAKLFPTGSATCASCGAEIIPGKRFCGDCGRRL